MINVADRAKQQLFILIKEYVDDGWSNARIKEFLQGGIELKVDDPQNLKTFPMSFEGSIITDEFLADARTLIQKINEDQEHKNEERMTNTFE